jgi:hypothetical protein
MDLPAGVDHGPPGAPLERGHLGPREQARRFRAARAVPLTAARILPLALLALGSCVRPQPAVEPSRAGLIEALLRAKALAPDLVLMHASHTCDLVADGVVLRVVDVRQIGKTAGSPRGVNHIAVFDPEWRLVQDIDYVDQRPLFCQGRELVLFGDLALHHEMPAGNVLVFRDQGATVGVRRVDHNSWPTFGEARGFPR